MSCVKNYYQILTGVPLEEFTQADIAANNVVYVHHSLEEVYHDTFTFSVSDGINDVIRTFTINISPVDDSIPVVTSNGILVQEGIRKLITEFDLKAVDQDTKVGKLFSRQQSFRLVHSEKICRQQNKCNLRIEVSFRNHL